MKKNIIAICVFLMLAGSLFAAGSGFLSKFPVYWSWFRSSNLFQSEKYVFAVPGDWKNVTETVPTADVFIVSDDSSTMPKYDPSMQLLRSAIYSETFNAPDVDAMIREFTNEINRNKQYGSKEIRLQSTKLNDGTDAQVMTAYIDFEKSTKTLFMKKVFFRSSEKTITVITGFVTAMRGADHFLDMSGAVYFVDAHILSVVCDRKKFSAKPLKGAYAKLPRGLNKTMEKCRKMFEVQFQKPAEAKRFFERVYNKYNYINSVSNALARICLASKDESLWDIPKGKEIAARAVEFTRQRDTDSLELLAIAEYKTGEKARAIELMALALGQSPGNYRYMMTYDQMKAGKFK